MKNPQASTAIERSDVKESTVMESGKYYLLIYLKNSVPLLLLCRYIVYGKYTVVYIILHCFNNFNNVRMEPAFFPTFAYSSNIVESICRKSLNSILISSSR